MNRGSPNGHFLLWRDAETVECLFCDAVFWEMNRHRESLGRWRTHYAGLDGEPIAECTRHDDRCHHGGASCPKRMDLEATGCDPIECNCLRCGGEV